MLYFAISTVLTAVSYPVGGLITQPVFVLSQTSGPLYGLGLYLGSHLFGPSDAVAFRWVCYSLITAAAAFSLPVLDQFMR